MTTKVTELPRPIQAFLKEKGFTLDNTISNHRYYLLRVSVPNSKNDLLLKVNRSDSRSSLRQRNHGSYHIADATLMEVVYVLERIYKQERAFITSCLNLIRSLNQINCNRELISRVMPIYMANPALSFADCCAAIYAELNEAQPLLTFDKTLAKKLRQAELLVV